MNILVCLKMVSQARFTDSLNDNGADRLAGGQLVINPADSYALELALRLKDKKSDTFITVLTMAPQYAEHILRTALAMGADRAVHICDGAFAGSDTTMTALAVSRAIERIGPQDLILCGKKAIDSETGHIGPQLGAILGLPCATNVTDIRFSERSGIELIRSQDNGIVLLGLAGKAVVTVCNGVSMVRSPGILGMRRSMSMPIEVLDGCALGFDDPHVGANGSYTRTISVTDTKLHSRLGSSTDSVSEGVEWISRLIKKGDEHDS